MNSKYNYEIGAVYGLKRLISLVKENGYTMAEVECVKCGRKSKVRPNSLYKEKTTKGKYYALTPTNEYIEFWNANEFAEHYGLKGARIRECCRKHRKYGEWTFGFVCDLSLKKPQSTIENHNMSE